LGGPALADAAGVDTVVFVSVSFAPWRSPPSGSATVVVADSATGPPFVVEPPEPAEDAPGAFAPFESAPPPPQASGKTSSDERAQRRTIRIESR